MVITKVVQILFLILYCLLILKLSDSFEETHRSESDVEVCVRVLNINYGHNRELADACRPLYEYSWLIVEIRSNHKSMTLENALNKAIDEMPNEFILKSFLKIIRSEVSSMLLTEYNEPKVMELFKEDGRREGRTEGIEEGRIEVPKVYSWLFKNGRASDAEKSCK